MKSFLEEMDTPLLSIAPAAGAHAAGDPVTLAVERVIQVIAQERDRMTGELKRLENDLREYRELRSTVRALTGQSRCLAIVRVVSARFNLPVRRFFENDRHQPMVWARQIAASLCRELLGMTLHATGEFFGQDHGTIIHSVSVVKTRTSVSTTDRQTVEDITAAVLKLVKP